MLGSPRGGDSEGDSGGSRARTSAKATAAAGAGSGGDDFEEFPAALEDTDDDLPF